MGVIISIVNNKGGVGKTTTTCNLADALGKRKMRVLVCDMDPQCNTTSKLLPKNTAIKDSIFDLLDPDKIDNNLNNFFYPTECKNVYLIPNIDKTGNLEPEMIENAPHSFFRLRKGLRDYALNNYDITIIDNPPNMGTFVLCSLYASDFVLIPIKAGSTDSVEGLVRATDLIHKVQEKGNPDLRFLRVLINGVDKRTAICKAVAEQVRKTFGDNQVFATEIPVNTTFERAEAMNDTIFQIDGSSPGAKAFRSLSRELIKIIER
jgi:cellulose biosynthesis protein BcsQ